MSGPYEIKITPGQVRSVHKRSISEIVSGMLYELQRIRFIVASEAKARIYDKSLGLAWLLVEPVIMAGLYYFITTVIFSFGGEERHFLFILVSVIMWRWFSRTVDGAPLCVVAYGGILKQTNFPVMMVVVSFMATEVFFWGMGFFVLIVFLMFYGVYPNITYFVLPLVLITQFSLMFVFTMFFSIAGTFIKDLSGVLYAFTSIWWYLSPGIYPISKIPEEYLWVYMLNPFAHILPAYRDILMDAKVPDLMPLLFIFVISTALGLLGVRLFNRAKNYFYVYL